MRQANPRVIPPILEAADLYWTKKEKTEDKEPDAKTLTAIGDHLRRFDQLASKLSKYLPLLENFGKFLSMD